jgi:Protein of unknown function (DUF1572)
MFFLAMITEYLESVKKQFRYYKLLGDKTFEQLSDEELFWKFNEESNSIAALAKHLAGNMLSRWTDFLTSDGEKEWRDRDSEFDDNLKCREEVLAKWNEGWKCLFDALESVNAGNFDTIVYIRNQGHTIMEAINRQLSHYPYHVGQIVFIGKMIKDNQWKSLSIPRGQSGNYNDEKFSKPKKTEHFTDQYIKMDGDQH